MIGCFFVILFRGCRIAAKQPNHSMQQYLAIALTLFVVLQAMINICVVTGIFPVTGIPLTFISYGGTSLLSSMFCMGVLMRLGMSS